MNLIGEQFVQNKPDKSKKVKTIILISIIVVVVAIVFIMISMTFFKEQKWTIKLNGQTTASLKDIIRFEEDGTLHIPIRDIASFLDYKSYNGNYINRSEDTDQCYIETNEEAVVFTVGSNTIEKIDTNTQETTYFELDEPVKMIDGKLYTTIDGIKKAYNVNFYYDADAKKITVETMQYLIEAYRDAIIEYRI